MQAIQGVGAGAGAKEEVLIKSSRPRCQCQTTWLRLKDSTQSQKLLSASERERQGHRRRAHGGSTGRKLAMMNIRKLMATAWLKELPAIRRTADSFTVSTFTGGAVKPASLHNLS